VIRVPPPAPCSTHLYAARSTIRAAAARAPRPQAQGPGTAAPVNSSSGDANGNLMSKACACCGSRPAAAAEAPHKPRRADSGAALRRQPASASRPPVGPSGPSGSRTVAAPAAPPHPWVPASICDGGSSADDSGSDADSFYSADDVLHSGAEPVGDDSSAGDVARVQTLLSSMSPESAAAQGWEQAAVWSSDAGSAVAYRKPATDDTGVFIFFFEATFPSIPPASLFQVQTDMEFRPKWDSYCVEVSGLGQEDGWELVYWEVKYPWPLSNRDYVYARRCHQPSTGSYVIVQRACELGKHRAEQTHAVRVCTFTSDVLITPEGTGGCKIKSMYQDDPRCAHLPR
jgi:hypothetical protein